MTQCHINLSPSLCSPTAPSLSFFLSLALHHVDECLLTYLSSKGKNNTSSVLICPVSRFNYFNVWPLGITIGEFLHHCGEGCHAINTPGIGGGGAAQRSDLKKERKVLTPSVSEGPLTEARSTAVSHTHTLGPVTSARPHGPAHGTARRGTTAPLYGASPPSPSPTPKPHTRST